MVYKERVTWSQLIASAVGIVVYLALVLPQVGTMPVQSIDWVQPMLWTVLGAIAGSILLSVVWGIAVGMRDPESATASDQRDREIEWLGGRVGQAFMVVGGLAGIALAAVDADGFWIGNVLFFGFALSALVDGVARLVAYRRGLV